MPLSTWLYISAAVSICALVAFLWFFWLGRRWRWPQGTRVEGVYSDFRATLIFDEDARRSFKYEPQKIATGCALAAHSLATAWLSLHEKRGWKVSTRSLKDIVVHVLGDEAYTKTYEYAAQRIGYGTGLHSAGMLHMMTTHVGSETRPMIACRASKFDLVPITGDLVIHELVHHLVGLQHPNLFLPNDDWYDAKHSLQDFWSSRSALSLESTGVGVYLKLRGRAGITV
jgi:hypothetical protein